MINSLRRLMAWLLLGILTTSVLHAAPLRLATTTSTQNSGLLDVLLPAFTQETGTEVHVIAVGTGKALKMGRDGDVDVVMVHAKSAEEKFVSEGYGLDRVEFMYNDFVLVGPSDDPANVSQGSGISDALQKIQQSQSRFISRGDDSGTHKKELKLWAKAGLQPAGSWYLEAGQGMGKVLQMAGEMDAYTLTDRGTWLAQNGRTGQKILSSGDHDLANPYGIIAVNPAKHPDTNYQAASKLIRWLSARSAQQMIKDFKINGEPLFVPLLLN